MAESSDCSGSLKRSRDTAGDSVSSDATSAKRTAATSDDSSSAHHGGVRITDLLNPAAAAVAAASGPALSAAHRLTLPSSLARAQSDDARHFHRQIANIQTQMQQQQQQQQAGSSTSVDPTSHFARTATAPIERAVVSSSSESSSCAQGLVREALELDKLYDIACVIIESIWPNHSTSQRTQLCSLRCFVAETHRQSRLCVDVLELCMFYLLRAKSIIQAKQRAARQKEEQEEQEQQRKAKQLQQQQQPAVLLVGDANNTPPLSPCNNLPSGQYTVDGQQASGVVLVGGGSITPGFDTNAKSSPITPDSVHSLAQVSFIPGDKQQILRNGMVTPLFPLNAKQQGNHVITQIPAQQRPLAGSTASLPNSYRSFVSTALKQADDAATAATISKPTENSGNGGNAAATSTPAAKPKPDVTKCGRRMFVAALISASKFIHDQTYSNRAWHKITKLPMAQISDMERAFLDMIDYRLYVDRTTYDKFHRLLARSGMRNGRLMVCDPSSSVSMSPSAGVMTPTSPQTPIGTSAQENTTSNNVSPWLAANRAAAAETLTNKVTLVAGSATAPVTPFTPVSGPLTGHSVISVGDLRTAMNAPLSISGTPQIQRPSVTRVVPVSSASLAGAEVQMQDQYIGILRAQQQQQQQRQHIYRQQQQHYHHMQQSSLNHS
ncbi:PHO85 cyclin-5 [Coemansia sp. RSA 2603]|nr:PHO85 cyclin-5 [Coemansia sp. RSA 2603]